MKISDLASDTPLQKIAEAKLSNSDVRSLWDLDYGTKEEKRAKSSLLRETKDARVYLIVVDEEIFKIGASESAKGFKETIGAYRNSGNSGNPSDRTYGIHIFVTEQLLLGKKVEFYGYYAEAISQTIPDMNGNKHVKMLTPPAKELEAICIKEYQAFQKNNFGIKDAFPVWNLQEAHKKWPDYIREGLQDLKQNKICTKIESIKSRLGL